MKNVIKLLQKGFNISLLIISVIAALPVAGQAQAVNELSEYSDFYIVTGFELGKSDLNETIKKRLDALVSGPAGLKAQCAAGYVVEAWGYSDHHRFKGVSKDRSDRLNDILAWDRLRVSIRYAVDELGMREHCFNDNDPVYADSDKRGVMFAIDERAGGTQLYKVLAQRVENNENILDDIQDKIADLQEKNAEQDERLDDHDDRITENSEINDHQDEVLYSLNQRVTTLEKKDWSVSKYLGVGLNQFADQYSFSGMAAIQVRSVELSAWYSRNPDIGTETIGEDIEGFVPETIDLRRETYGAGLTWFAFQTNRFDFGPMVKFEHGEDIQQGHESNIRKWDAVSAGMQAELKIYKSLRLRANVAYAPWINLSTFENPEYRTDSNPISGMVTLGLRFN